jgi:cytoskeletal protein CcmA (bactofilin family)
MAIWKETTTSKKDATPMSPATAPAPTTSTTAPSNTETVVPQREADFPVDLALTTPPSAQSAVTSSTARRPATHTAKESVIAADITISGKIDGAGHVRIAGKFEGDVHIQGDLTIEQGAKLTGSVRAGSVAIAGEVEGNIESAASVEMMSTGVLNGDLKAGMLTVASGSRMRGKVEFGWSEEEGGKSVHKIGARQAS